MTDFLPRDIDQFGAMLSDLKTKVAVLQQQLNNQVVGAVACTSATHPVNPAVGMEIFETDTNNTQIWDGANWRPIQTGAWITTFVPTWTETGGSPAIGNGSIVTGWAKTGRTVTGRYQFLFGSTTNFGVPSQAWNFSVPVTPKVPASGFWNVGTWSGLANGLFYVGAVRMETTGVLGLFANAVGFSVNSTVPSTWNSSGYLQLDFTYESTA